MKSDFLKKSFIGLVIGTLILGPAATCNVYASAGDTDVYGGAAGLSKEAIEAIRNGDLKESDEEDTAEERDLTGTILNGISVGSIDLSGKSYDESVKLIDDYVDSIADSTIVLNAVEGNYVEVTARDLGISWDDTDTIADALALGRDGNLVERYKEKKDLENEKKTYSLKLNFDKDAIRSIVEEQGSLYDIEAVNASISKADGDFTITPGVTGQKVDVTGSVNEIVNKLAGFDGTRTEIDLKIVADEPKTSTEDLEMIHDVIGSYKTSFSSSGTDRSGNVRNGTSLVDGTVLYPGEQFSMYKTVSPFTEENGYFLAGSYLNGMVVESLGGGICQVSSTLYNAVLRAELEVDERYNHSMIVSYVDLSSDAAISGTSKDFKFTNNTDYPIYIEGYTTSDKQVVFNIYGVETRPSNRKVTFESKQISETVPDTEKIVADPSMALGSISVQSAHTGYVGELWKVVTVDGVETERTQVNKSTYQPSPKTATVGTATDNPTALSMIQQAIATGSIDTVKSTISQINALAAAAAAVPAVSDGLAQ